MMTIDLLMQTSVNAVYAASFMALVAVGLVLIFGVMGVVNFAHGELYMLGAYVVAIAYAGHQLPYFLAVALGLLLVGLLGIAMEYTLFRPLRKNPLAGLIASIGLLLVLQAAVTMGFGVRARHISPPTREMIQLAYGASIPLQRLYVIVAAIGLLSALWLFLRHSRLGWALRACSQDAEAAALQGISLNFTARMAMFIGAALAGVAGALTSPLVKVDPNMGHSVIVTAFIVIIVGGLGSLEGAVLVSILYAFVHTFVTTYVGGVVADMTGLLLMLLVLVIRPTGLFGAKERA